MRSLSLLFVWEFAHLDGDFEGVVEFFAWRGMDVLADPERDGRYCRRVPLDESEGPLAALFRVDVDDRIPVFL
jgi:hypothetical protein